ncbi:sugar transferase [Alteriqipengyuania lutimaris]|uniref:Sugar transferase n=1 Tax=Alteriqipengyuania lutimaris TaxID=1538146 RepID=A0A395LJ93_9SPHN|nr:sugar transferase [Alteriqipengyuania lutimaris]MBB3034342.1 lipopolysaccharide/colanic/teichoic acid biosynthesis glycosyltransferase [Alteriqipengyuania lutimaris]RDS76755.1 sugar transferase [Alteriqipengyuania lutimaris]
MGSPKDVPTDRFSNAATRLTFSEIEPTAATMRRRIVFNLLALDLLCILLSFGFAAMLRAAVLGDADWVPMVLMTMGVYVVAAFNSHSLSREGARDPFVVVRGGLQALVTTAGVLLLIAYVFKTSDTLPRFIAISGFAFSAILITTARYSFSRNLEWFVEGDPFKIVLLTDRDRRPDSDTSHVINIASLSFDPATSDPAAYDHFARAIRHADRIIVDCKPDQRTAWAHALKGAGIDGEILMPELDKLAPLAVGSYDGKTSLVISAGALGWYDRSAKRLFDLVLAGLGIVVLAPVFLLIALAVKIDSRGPVLFRQTRIGRGNEMFEMLKFRSMRIDQTDTAGDRSASRDDDRITRVGRIIRATSLDELPQLFNVISGKMSIVGPRPHALGSRAADKLFWDIDTRYWHRHAAKPGLTGLAQVRGFRGATMEEDDLRNRLQADLEYLESWSIWRDMVIVALTFRVLLHRNAF